MSGLAKLYCANNATRDNAAKDKLNLTKLGQKSNKHVSDWPNID